MVFAAPLVRLETEAASCCSEDAFGVFCVPLARGSDLPLMHVSFISGRQRSQKSI